MKKLTLLLFFLAAIATHTAYAQPTFDFTPDQIVVDEGDPVCFTLEVEDFTNIIEVSFTIQWDPGVMDFVQINSLANLPGLDLSDFDASDAANGIVTFHWSDGQNCATANSGPTLADFVGLFDICFTATGIYGNHTPICITDSPVDKLVRRSSANCLDIGEYTDCGFISIGTSPLTVNISSADGFEGDVVCLDFKVEDFKNLVSFQFGIFWDTTILEFVNVQPSNLQEFTLANIGQTQVDSGILNLSWSTTSNGVSLSDGTQILQVCFKIIGDCGDASEVYIAANEPGIIEVINQISGVGDGTNIGILQTKGEVSVNCFDPNAITVEVQDKNVCPGEQFTVDVTVGDFDDITKLQFNLKWNPNVIQLNNAPSGGVTYPDGAGCFLFGTGSTVTKIPTQGRIEVDWNSNGFGCTLPNDHILMRLHFTAIGSGGSNSTIAVVNPIFVDEFGGLVTNLGINNNNGLVNICELDKPTISASSATLNPGEIVCIEFNVQDFDEITRTQYTIAWEPTVLAFQNVQALNLTSLGMGNFLNTQTAQGVLGVEWENGSPVTVPDGTTIFEVCFEVIGDPDDCSAVDFTDFPWDIDVKTGSSSGTNVGLNGQPGVVCVENPLSFFTELNDVFGSPGAEVCLDVTVENFTQITELQYSINWNTSILQYSSVQPTGNLANFNATSYDDDISLTEDGQLIIDWNSSNMLQGTTVPDGTSIFQICFTVIGDDGECSGVIISQQPQPYMVKTAPTGDANLGLTTEAGSVCVNASIDMVDALVTDVDCPSVPTGAIDITVMGGSGSYVFQWQGPSVNPSAEDQSSLMPGNYAVTVQDAANPALVVQADFTVGLAANAPVANAGVDTTFNCGSFGLMLDGTASSTGPDLSYLWTSFGTLPGVVAPGTETTLTPQIFGGKNYLLTVIDNSTGCIDQDTVIVNSPNIASPEIAEPDMYTCANDTLVLDGGQTAFGFDVLWTTSDGSILSGTESDLQALVTASGTYYLTFSNASTNCSRTDTVLVMEDVTPPTALAGDDGVIGCVDEDAPIDGMGSSFGPEYVYEWSAMGNGEICGSEIALQTTVCAPGTYQLLVTNQTNGCTAIDMVTVVGDTLKPVANAGPNQSLDCVVEMLTLNGANSSQGNDFVYTWMLGANTLGNDLTLDVAQAGTYILEVMDTTNGCSAVSQVVVTDLSQTVNAVATASNGITCNVDTALLSWTGSVTGNMFSYTWNNPSGMPIGSAETITVSEPGMYTLVVLNTQNQCDSTVQVMVPDQTAPPMAAAGDDTAIGCVPSISLTGTTDAGNANLIFQWQGPGAGCIQNGTTTSPQVSCPGTYTFNVVDTATGCSNADQIVVSNDQTPPGADAGDNQNFPCSTDELTLQGTTSATDFNAQWTSIPVVPIQNPTTLQPTITLPAQYILTVTSTGNQCTSSSTVTITEPDGPVADAGADATVDCLNTEATLSAINSTIDGTTLVWEALTGNDPADPNAIEITVGAGEYQLTVTDQDGCTAVDVVMVENIGALPNVNAGGNQLLPCDAESIMLTATADAGLSYTWTDENQMIVGSGLTLEVTEPGMYTLTVFNSTNNCENADMATVSLADGGAPADAAFDHDPCDNEAMLLGNLPNGATGAWMALASGQIEEPDAATTLVTGFAEGANQFVWTLSLGFCENYSSDTITISLNQAVPQANADFATLDDQSGGVAVVSVLDNDNFDAGLTTYALLDNSSVIGEVTMSPEGVITYTKERCFVGTVEIFYELCNTNCPDLCSTGILTIDVQPVESEECDKVANGITPNGDGTNDELVFDLLLSNPPEMFPDNEIIIFNRWGDVVYQARPYQNDWRGTNDGGKELPQGTYYYILRLNIANGDIIRGDITILK